MKLGENMKDFKQDLFNYLVANDKFEEFYGGKKENDKKEEQKKKEQIKQYTKNIQKNKK